MSDPLDGRRHDADDTRDPTDPTDPPDELTRALSAPGTPDELAGHERYLAMFRAEHAAASARPAQEAPTAPVPSAPSGTVLAWRERGRAVRRVGARGAVAGAIAVALAGGGVAAAYAGTLPAPLQRTAHQVLGPVGVPAAVPETPQPTRAKAPKPSRSSIPSASPSAEPSSATPTPSASGSPSARPSPRRTPDPSRTRTPSPTTSPSETLQPSGTATPYVPPTPTTSVSPTESTSPTTGPTEVPPTPTPTAAPVVPRAITISSPGRRVGVDDTPLLTGTVTGSRGRPSAGTIVLLEQNTGQGWRRVASETTDDDGRVSIASVPIGVTTSFRLTVGDLHSSTWRVQVQPTLTADVTMVTGGRRPTALVSVVTDGARAGDLVRVVRSSQGGDRTIGRGRVASDGTVTITVPLGPNPAPHAVVLPGTRQHTSARTPLTVPLPSGQPLG